VLTTLKIADDRQNDLALLKVSHKPSHVFPLSGDSPYPLQDIVVAGFPFGDRVSSSLKFTKGIVSSLSGMGNNYSEIQIDAGLQPGNSGGPIIDEYGNIIAVAVAKLDMKKILKDYGVIPENTNFGIKTSAVRNLLQGNAVSTKPPNTGILSKQELSRTATDGTVFLSCWMTVAQIDDMKSRKVLFTDLE
jgi:serine protease Do